MATPGYLASYEAAGELLRALAAPLRIAIAYSLIDGHIGRIVADAVSHAGEPAKVSR
jgi:hypothetical protein